MAQYVHRSYHHPPPTEIAIYSLISTGSRRSGERAKMSVVVEELKDSMPESSSLLDLEVIVSSGNSPGVLQ